MEHPGALWHSGGRRVSADILAGGHFTPLFPFFRRLSWARINFARRCRFPSLSLLSRPGKKSKCAALQLEEVFQVYFESSRLGVKQQQPRLLFFWECVLLDLPRKSREGQLTPEEDMYWTFMDWKILMAIVLLWDQLQALELRPTRRPLYSQKPLVLAWNAPTEDCAPRHGVRFELDLFQIVASPNEAFFKQNLTIFYKERLGLYPYFEEDKSPVNGGLPQVANLERHLEKMPDVVKKYIREPDAEGLAVIDWEEWRPLWIRNWDAKDIYRKHSRELVRQKNPTWSEEQVFKVAQQEYELSAKKFMLETLKLAKSLRPNQLWGFYLFPDCYNHDYRRTLENYTGRCPDVEVARNEQLKWLWEESTALFPSVYLASVLMSSNSGKQFVRNRVKEGMRLASSGEGLARPVFVYARPTYVNSLVPLTETDLVSTIGESVALGAAGIILWGDVTYVSSKTSCSELKAYLQDPLSKYLLNVSKAAELCSETLCGSHGRCLRRNSDSDVYLHLSPLTHAITNQNGKLAVTGELGEVEKMRFETDFQCQCYSGYQGETCQQKDPLHQRGNANVAKTSILQCAFLLVVCLVLS